MATRYDPDPAVLDAADPLAPFRDRFVFSDPGPVYLDGNSLGRLPRATVDRLAAVVGEEWGGELIRGWDHWLDEPRRVGDLLATEILGARSGEVIVSDSTTVNFYKLARAALTARQGRRIVVTDRANFPTDRYVLEGLVGAGDGSIEIAWLDPDPTEGPQPDEVASVLDAHPGDVALVTLSHVNYRSAAIADMAAITELVHAAGALTIWDLCHSAGSIPVDLDRSGADLAVGCTYKYLNGGPGSPAFTYVAHRHQSAVRNPLPGWVGCGVDMVVPPVGLVVLLCCADPNVEPTVPAEARQGPLC
jgi:kynureninase